VRLGRRERLGGGLLLGLLRGDGIGRDGIRIWDNARNGMETG
jgi:hypothetical protein